MYDKNVSFLFYFVVHKIGNSLNSGFVEECFNVRFGSLRSQTGMGVQEYVGVLIHLTNFNLLDENGKILEPEKLSPKLKQQQERDQLIATWLGKKNHNREKYL